MYESTMGIKVKVPLPGYGTGHVPSTLDILIILSSYPEFSFLDKSASKSGLEII